MAAGFPVAAVNGPSSTTVSGDPGRDQRFGRGADELLTCFHRALRVDVAYHSAQMDPLREELQEVLDGLAP